MLKERIKEVFEFTNSESPYRKANKGWINKDMFLDLNPSTDKYEQTNEAAKITLFWSPINSLLSNIFIIIILGAIFVFSSISFVKGRFDYNLFNNFEINNFVNVDEDKAIDISSLRDMDSMNSSRKQNLETKDLDQSNEIYSLDYDLNKTDEKIINKKIDTQDASLQESESNEEMKTLQNEKQKSNFI